MSAVQAAEQRLPRWTGMLWEGSLRGGLAPPQHHAAEIRNSYSHEAPWQLLQTMFSSGLGRHVPVHTIRARNTGPKLKMLMARGKIFSL